MISMKSLATAVMLACAGTATAADLLDVYRQARSSDPTYAAAKSGWAAAQERIPQARAGLLPLASVSASTQYTDRAISFRDDTVPRQTANFGTNNVSLTVTQPLYRRQNWIATEQALTQVQQADAQL